MLVSIDLFYDFPLTVLLSSIKKNNPCSEYPDNPKGSISLKIGMNDMIVLKTYF